MPKIKDIPKIDRPRERLLQKGSDALSKTDLLAILLGSGVKGTNVQKLSNTIIKKFGNNFLNTSIQDLISISGIGKVKAMQIISAIALVKRIYAEQEGDDFIVKNIQDVLTLTHNLKDKKKEYLVCLYLNARNALIKKETISIGLLDKSLLHPREVFYPATELNAASIILIHNHPTGDATPSEQDKLIVKKISEAGNIMGIPVVDFLITAKNGHYSFYQKLKNDDAFDYVAEGFQLGLFDLLEVEGSKYENNTKDTQQYSNNLHYVDLFCGAGGFSLGFDKAGFNNVFSLDIENSFCKTYQYNFPKHTLIQKDIKNLTADNIESLVNKKEIDVIVGGPPCQGFSIAGNIGRNFIDDPRNYLFKEFVRVVSIVQPKYLIMENVARLYTHNKGKTREEIILDFERIGYTVEAKILNTADYGVPQVRKRVFFIGSKVKKNIIFPKENNKNNTVKQAIHDLPILNSGEKSSTPNHIAMNHSVQMLKKMSYVSDGGDRTEIPEDIRPKSGDIRKYIRYQGDKPSITVTGDMRKVFHYHQNRALTVRELARLQTFPDNFIFQSNSISQQQQVGNAVPPLMAEIIANMLKDKINQPHSVKHLNKFPKINFIGNKEKITPWICEHFPLDANSILDAFSGGCSVSYEAKRRGYQVLSNDISRTNYLLSKSLIENNNETLNLQDVDIIFSGVPFKGFMCQNYANKFFFEEECMALDLYRKNIKKLTTKYKRSLGLALLRRAMIRKMPYSRFNISWDKIKQLRDEEYSYQKYKRRRAYHNASFKSHFLDNMLEYNNAVFDNKQNNKVFNLDVFDVIAKNNTDIIYLDPPYTGTMNDYFGFYGVIDSYVDSKKHPPFFNNFIDKKQSLALFKKLFASLGKYKYWFLSYNSGAYPNKEELLYIIGQYSKNIEIIEKPHVYKITGKDKKQKNKEYLFIVRNEDLL
ncbi:DNA-cytosine methyltransferase (EC [uncultured Gammaproteobacteria bacterium]|nr:DNA-cytosine methyltransferase (EC [uncultured Gammaproteobacteria bacterium]